MMAKDDVKTVDKDTPAPDPDAPVFEGSLSADEPQVAPDGHVNLSKEDINARR